MTSEEIQKWNVCIGGPVDLFGYTDRFNVALELMQEIAFQLAKLNEAK